MHFHTTLTLALAITGTDAFWRMICHGSTGIARMDPMVDPGVPSGHLHVVHGSSGFSMTADYDDLINADCTSCSVAEDKSAYWVPQLMFHDAETGEYSTVDQKGGLTAYYNMNAKPGDPQYHVRSFPKDFRMIAGSNERHNYTAGDPYEQDPPKSNWAALGEVTQDYLSQRALGFNCLNYKIANEAFGYRHYMPDKDFIDKCEDGFRVEIVFPSCWDGKNVDSEDHKSHMAYSDLVIDGGCPDSHPIKTIGMMYEIIWWTDDFKDKTGTYLFANGDQKGYSMHADFMMGWEEDFLANATKTCTNPSGLIQDCPLFTLQDEDTSQSCKFDMPDMLAGEDKSPMSTLPGTAGAGAGTGASVATSYNVPAPSVPSVDDTSLAASTTSTPSTTKSSSSALDLAVQAVAASSAVSEPAAAPVAPAAEVTQAPAPPQEDDTASYQVISTEYRTVGNVVQAIVWEEAVVYITVYEDATSTVTVSQTGKQRRKRNETQHRRRQHAHQHLGRHVHGELHHHH